MFVNARPEWYIVPKPKTKTKEEKKIWNQRHCGDNFCFLFFILFLPFFIAHSASTRTHTQHKQSGMGMFIIFLLILVYSFIFTSFVWYRTSHCSACNSDWNRIRHSNNGIHLCSVRVQVRWRQSWHTESNVSWPSFNGKSINALNRQLLWCVQKLIIVFDTL